MLDNTNHHEMAEKRRRLKIDDMLPTRQGERLEKIRMTAFAPNGDEW